VSGVSGRTRVAVGWFVVLGALGACAQRPAPKIAGDGELVLELGGSSRSLAASLQGLGVELLPPREPLAAPAAPPVPADERARDGDDAQSAAPGGADRSERADGAAPAQQPPAAAGDWFEVALAPRQTLMDLAHKHLGSGLRFKELLTLNGWTEKDARRLRVGQKVKIPKAAPR